MSLSELEQYILNASGQALTILAIGFTGWLALLLVGLSVIHDLFFRP